MQLLSSHKFDFWALGLFSSSGACAPSCTDCLMVMWDFKQMTTRYLCLSRTHLGPVAEWSCIFCINAVAVADGHLTEVMWRQGLQVLYSTVTHLSAWTQGSEECVKCSGPGGDMVCFEKKRDAPLPYFLSTRVMVQGGLYQTREYKDKETCLPAHSTKWSCCFELLSSWESFFVKSFLTQGVLQVSFVSSFSRKCWFFASGIVCLQGSSQRFLIPELGNTHLPSNPLLHKVILKEKQGRAAIISLTPARLHNYYGCQWLSQNLPLLWDTLIQFITGRSGPATFWYLPVQKFLFQ